MKWWRSVTARFKTSKQTSATTVRYMFPVFLGFALFLGANSISTQSSYIRLETDATVIRADERFHLDVLANAHEPVNAVDITLRFDSASVEVISVDRGQSVLTIWTEEPKVTNNTVTLRGGTFRRGFLGEHKIATIVLRAKQTGQSDLSTASATLLAGDGSGTPVRVSEVADSKISLFIYDENTSPSDIGANVQVALATDIDGDGKVTLRDISAFMAAWSNRSIIYDFDGDGRMTFRDFSIILASFFTR